jgi:hypothetical protein
VRGRAVAAVVSLAAGICATVAAPVRADTIDVTNTNDSGPGSLRAAITQANASSGDVIDIDVEGKVFLLTALPDITEDMQILGPGARRFRVIRDASAAAFRIFTISSGTDVTISGLTVKNGSSEEGGGIRNDGTVLLDGLRIKGNDAPSTSGNKGGGGFLNAGTATVDRTVIAGNSTSGSFVFGGGIYNIAGANLTVTRSTIANNSATSTGMGLNYGGGLANNGSADLSATTVSGNTHGGFGGVANVANNYAPAGATIALTNTIVALPSGSVNCGNNGGTWTSNGFNLDDDGTCLFAQTADQSDVSDPGLKPLGDYKGQTETVALKPDSPAVDKGTADGFTTDQRNRPRPVDDPAIDPATGGDNSDIGAFERQ